MSIEKERIDSALADLAYAQQHQRATYPYYEQDVLKLTSTAVIAARLEQLNDSVNALTEKVGELCDATWRR